ncbi:MAG: DMT family transporter [Gammaproteobacteria bacterium]|nr:DMT family transporter [Gammaproteobacteria bacterium]
MKAPLTAQAATPWRGVAMALAVGISFASNTSLAAYSYRDGATPLAVLLARSFIAFVLLNLLMMARGVPRRLPMPQRRVALMIGCIFASYSYGVLVAIKFLPVGLVVATFYTFPILIGIVEWWSGRQAFHGRTALALALAFTGILLALDVQGTPVHRLGITLCLLGAVGVTTVMTLSAKVRGGGDSRPVTLHMLGTALTLFTLVAIFHGGIGLPHTLRAWAAFGGATLFYSFGVITLFVVVAEIGPVKASLIMNIEPITSVLLGFLLLDQRLGALQLVGIALVVSAVLLIENSKLRRVARM